MKICHVTSSHKRYDGRIFQKECTSLAKKYDVTLLCADNLNDEVKNNVTIKSIKITKKNRFNRFFIIPRKLKKLCIIENADIYHFHDPEMLNLAYYMKKKGKKVIFDSHEDNLNRLANRSWIPNLLKPLAKKYFANKEKKVLKTIDAVITVADYIQERLLKINPNTYIITNYPIINNKELSNLKNNNVLCFAGGVSEQYMHHNILKAIEDLNVKYKVAGPIFDNYMEKLKLLPGIAKTEFLGQLSKKEVDTLYLNSGIGMVILDYSPNTSFKHGTMGNTKIFEYMSCGLPVIATDFDVWIDFVPNNCGICVNPNNVEEIRNAIELLLENPKKAKEMGKKGRKLVETKFNWQKEEIKLIEIYEKL